MERALKPYLHAPFMITKRKDSKYGEIVVLLIESNDLGEVKHVCQHHLPKYWRPRDVVFVEKIPMTETGKPARRQAEELLNGECRV